MAPVAGAVAGSWAGSSVSSEFGVLFLLLLLLLSIFLAALCSDCGRRSFDLGDTGVERTPSVLIKVKLEDTARENPMINDIKNDEKESSRPSGSTATSEEEDGTWYKPWRSHLGLQQQETNHAPSSEHMASPAPAILNADPRSAPPNGTTFSGRVTPPSDTDCNQIANHEPASGAWREGGGRQETLGDNSLDSMYARVSRKEKNRSQTPPDLPPAPLYEEEEEPSPPLPYRNMGLER